MGDVTERGADDTVLDVVEPFPSQVLDLLGDDVVEEGVDGEVSSESVLFGGADLLCRGKGTITGILDYYE